MSEVEAIIMLALAYATVGGCSVVFWMDKGLTQPEIAACVALWPMTFVVVVIVGLSHWRARARRSIGPTIPRAVGSMIKGKDWPPPPDRPPPPSQAGGGQAAFALAAARARGESK